MKIIKSKHKISFLCLVSLFITSLIISTNSTTVQSLDKEIQSDYHFSALINRDPIFIYNNSAFGLYGFPGDGSPGNPYRIENYNITASAAHGIHINNTNVYFKIQNCYIDADIVGIFILNVYNQTAEIVNNYCVNNAAYGISLDSAFESIIADNTLLYNGGGIYTDFCDGSEIVNNTCLWNNDGIFLDDTYKTVVIENECSWNSRYGIIFMYVWKNLVLNNTCTNNQVGIFTNSTSRSNFTENAFNNNEYGILLNDSEENIFKYNYIGHNTDYGTSVYTSSSNNVFHHNAFVNNALGLGKQQALDNGTGNWWFYTVNDEGNYWSDWGGTEPYAIDGTTGNVDLYPLGTSPVIAEFSSAFYLLYLAIFMSISSIGFILLKRHTKRK